MCKMAKAQAVAIGLILLTQLVPLKAAIMPGQVDTFENGTLQSWQAGNPVNPNPPTNVATGGPAGADDNFLRIRSHGSFGAGGKLVVFNENQWSGNYLSAAVNAIQMQVNNLGTTNLVLRLILEDGNHFQSLTTFAPVNVAPGSGWNTVSFSLAAANMRGGTYNTVMGSVTELNLVHSSSVISDRSAAPNIAAQLGIDNITAVAGPPALRTWNVNANGNWSQATNWTGGVPNAVGVEAVFGGVITAPHTVTVDIPITVGRIDFENANAYTIAGTNALTLDVSSGEAQLNVKSGSHTISAPVTLADNTLVTVTPAASNLSITGALNAGGRNLTKAGAGTLTVNNVRAAGLSVNGGAVAIAPNGGNGGASVVSALSIAGAPDAWTAKLDVANNDTVVNSTAANKTADFNRLYNQLKQGFNDGTWMGQGITSATAAANTNFDTGLSVIDNALVGYTDFSGQPVTADSILLKYTYYGDIDQNGQVDADDLTVFASGFGRASGATQVDGDIDFNGAVNADDLTVFANNFGKGIGSPLAVASVQAVPEPGTFLLLMLGAVSLILHAARRRLNTR